MAGCRAPPDGLTPTSFAVLIVPRSQSPTCVDRSARRQGALAPLAAADGALGALAAGAGVLDSVVAGSLATIDADGSEGSDAGEVGNCAAAAEELAGMTTAVADSTSALFFEHAASASSEAATTEVIVQFILISPCTGIDVPCQYPE